MRFPRQLFAFEVEGQDRMIVRAGHQAAPPEERDVALAHKVGCISVHRAVA